MELEEIGVFPRLAEHVGIIPCVFGNDRATACAQLASDPDLPPYRTITDLIIRLSKFPVGFAELPGGDDVVDWSDTNLNVCHGSYAGYKTMQHEAGHALGIRGTVHVDGQEAHHPSLSQVVMHQKSSFYCSPTPFDIMAVYALYQTTE